MAKPEGLPKPQNSTWMAIVTILMMIAIFLSGLFAPKFWNWALTIFFMIVFIAAIGKLITGRYSGIFINERNKMTLSRFQMVIWTLIVLSAFLTIALTRIYAGVDDPLNIALPIQLWELLGISTTSLVGSPLILSTKVPKKLAGAARTKAISFLTTKGETPQVAEIVDEFGILAVNDNFKKAKFTDMFMGDEKGNEDFIDMAKVQMFFFTLIIAFSYMVLLVNLIMTATPAGLSSFPELDNSLVALLGISSGGYLANKTYDHTKNTSSH